MGKKAKTGKARRDKFYQLAKETGYRARSAFKLIQLNRKYEFLQKARACIDLCAAPGGWLQVAHKYMPVSSIIIGVDLVPIRSISNVITLQADITTDKCRLELKKSLQTWKADVVLNDGAPNIGKNWLHDAFNQNQLTLSALKLACQFLSKGGYFVTKVFRSKDYHSLLWIFRQLFRKVHATKPQASRHESAEIFVVCERYLAPDKIDEKFFDPKFVFEEIDPEPSSKLNIIHPEKRHKRAEGYVEGDYTLYHKVPASEFILGSTHIELLENASEIILDDVTAQHSLTTNEIVECCKDIKVLGRRELRLLLTWRKKMKEILEKSKVNKEETIDSSPMSDENEEEKVAGEIKKLVHEEAMDMKRKKRKVLKERKKLRDKMDLKMLLPNDEPLLQEDENLFKLSKITSKTELNEIEKGDLSFMDGDTDEEVGESRQKTKKINREKKIIDSDCAYSDEDDDDDDHTPLKIKSRKKKKSSDQNDEDSSSDNENIDTSSDDDDDDDAEKEGTANPLVVDVEKEDKANRLQKNVEMWFKKDSFTGVENDEDEDLDLQIVMENKRKLSEVNRVVDDDDDDSGNASDYDINTVSNDDDPMTKKETTTSAKVSKSNKRLKLDPEGLALGAMMIKSKKIKRDIIDSAYNRFTFNDENLPSWFTEDENKHSKKQIPVTKELVNEYKEKLREINARPIKKVAEAKARKKKRALKKLERAKKKAESITETSDMTDKEKMQQIKQIYKKATKSKKGDKDLSYVVAKKGMGRKVRRPNGVTGRFKVVDPRMKKDDRQRKTAEKLDKKKKKRKHRQS